MGTLFKLGYAHSSVPNVLFRPTTVQMPNLELIETKRITVHGEGLMKAVIDVWL
jgi:hypothetical protein